MMPSAEIVFLFNVDKTGFDNDYVAGDLMHYSEREIGHEVRSLHRS